MAAKLRKHNAITGIKFAKIEYKLSLYADDVVRFFLTNNLETLPELHELFVQYSRVSGYKINYGKYCLMGINISDQTKNRISLISKACWNDGPVRYLGILLLTIFAKMVQNNLVPIINSTRIC